MRISCTTGTFEKLGDLKAILSAMKEAGFDAYDFNLCRDDKNSFIEAEDYIEQAYVLRKFADEIGILCNQSHAIYPTWMVGEDAFNKSVYPLHERALRITGILGGKVCVFHPTSNGTPESNAEVFLSLLPVAKEYNVRIGIENMFRWDYEKNMAKFAACSDAPRYKAQMDLLDKDWFVANVDTGHCEVEGLDTSCVELIRALKDRVASLHFQDNNKKVDDHFIPFFGKINFTEICKALKEIGYSGDITLEPSMPKSMPVELYPSAMKLMADVASYMRSLINE